MKQTIPLSLSSLLLLAVAGCESPEQRAAYNTRPYNAAVVSSAPSPYVGYSSDTSTYTTTVSDTDLVPRVRQQIANNARLEERCRNVQVSSRNGVVTLSGNVPSTYDREMLETCVRNTPGVVSVTDELAVLPAPTGSTTYVTPSARVYSQQPTPVVADNTSMAAGEMFNLHVHGLNDADRTLAQRIIGGLQTDQVLLTVIPKVNITVADGRVSLRGTVQSDEQRRIIESAVARAAGVSVVDDQLQVIAPRY
jgi:osmotically-inducible protein OsmY